MYPLCVRRLIVAQLVIVLAIIAGFATAQAQTTLAVTGGDEVVQNVTAGQTLTAGTFSTVDTATLNVALSAVSINLTDADLFSSLSLTVQIATNTQTFAISSPTTGANTVSLTGLPAMQPGQTASFTLTATISNNPSRLEDNSVAYAGLRTIDRRGGDRGKLAGGLIGLLALGLLLAPSRRGGKARLVLAALLVILALGEIGCGSSSPFGSSSPSSTQSVSAMSGTDANNNAVTFTGLPVTLGTLTF